MYDDISFDIGGKKRDKLLSRIAALEAERDQLLARIEDTDSACADYAFAGGHTAREIIEKLHDRIRGYKTDRDLLAEANDQLRAELAELRRFRKAIMDYDSNLYDALANSDAARKGEGDI